MRGPRHRARRSSRRRGYGGGRARADAGRRSRARRAGRRARACSSPDRTARASSRPRCRCARRSWRRTRPPARSGSRASRATSSRRSRTTRSQTGVGVSRAVSAGNAAAVNVPDYLEYFAADPDTKVALAYVEGIADGRDFFERAREVVRRQPLVLLKGGATAGGQRAAASHTGALASDDRVFDGVCRQAGSRRGRALSRRRSRPRPRSRPSHCRAARGSRSSRRQEAGAS